MTAMLPLLAGALAIGVALGLLGGGGTVLTVPLLQISLGLDTTQAVAMSLPVVAAASATGALAAWHRGVLQIGATLGLALTTSVGAYLGAAVGRGLSPHMHARLLAATLAVAAVMMWWRREAATERPVPAVPARLAAAGLAVGVVTGMVGVGGGFLLVPALVTLGGYTFDRAVPASLLVIACSAAVGALGYAGRVAIPWPTVGVLAAAAAAGVLAGRRLGHALPPGALHTAFSILLLLTAGYVLTAH